MFKSIAEFFKNLFKKSEKIEPPRENLEHPIPVEVIDIVPEKYRQLFTKENYNKKSLWYDLAIREKPMAVQGKYPDGYPIGAGVHSTAGRGSPQNTMQYGRSKKSVPNLYTCIGRDGDLFQGDPLTDYGWHSGATGGSSFNWNGKKYTNTSKYLVGIETTSACMVRNLRNGFMRPWWNEEKYLAQFGKTPDPKQDIPEFECRHFEGNEKQVAGWYHVFTKAQEDAIFYFCLWLKWNNPMVFNLELVIGHDELCVVKGSKNDPGGCLSVPMYEFRNRLIAKYNEIVDKILINDSV